MLKMNMIKSVSLFYKRKWFLGVSRISTEDYAFLIKHSTQCFMWLIWHTFIISTVNVTSKYHNWNAHRGEWCNGNIYGTRVIIILHKFYSKLLRYPYKYSCNLLLYRHRECWTSFTEDNLTHTLSNERCNSSPNIDSKLNASSRG